MSSRMDISEDQEQILSQQLIQELRQMQARLELQESYMKDQAQIIKSLQVYIQSTSKNPKLTSQVPKREEIPSSLVHEKLPALEKFKGDRNMWDEWYLAPTHKLKSDGAVIDDEFHQFMYTYSRLEGKATKMVTTTVQKLSEDESGEGMKFLTYFNTIFGDAKKKARAQ